MSDPSFDDAMRALLDEKEKAHTHHPHTEVLADFRDKLLTPDQMEDIRDHLAECRQCIETLRELKRPLDLPVDLNAAEAAPQSNKSKAPKWTFYLSLAAAVFIGFLLHPLIIKPEQESFQVGGAQLTLNAVERSSERGPRKSAPSNSLIVLTLVASTDPSPEGWLLRILDQEGHKVMQKEGVQPTNTGGFQIILQPGRLKPGEYRIEIAESVDSQAKLVYQISLEDTTAPN